MTVRLSAPGKTFLAGEYAVLVDAPALILNTGPRFSLEAVKGSGRVKGIHAESPAGRWIAKHLNDWDIEFNDPYAGEGGLGASSAQFLLAHSLAGKTEDFKKLRHDYREVSNGSGADVLAQAVGGVALVDTANCGSTSRPWPFKELQFAILRTGNKLATHKHLQEIDRAPLQKLVAPAHRVIEHFSYAQEDKFIDAVNDYAERLREMNLQSEETLKLIDKLRPQCLAVKGCGAMGADTILVLYRNGEFANALATNKDLSPGLVVE